MRPFGRPAPAHYAMDPLADLVALAALAAAPPAPQKRQYEQRSADLLRDARAAKREKRLRAEADSQRALAESTQAKLALVAARHPYLRKALGVVHKPGGEQLAAMDMRTACCRRIRGASFSAEARAQARSAHLLAEVLLDRQRSLCDAICDGAGAEELRRQHGDMRVVGIQCQWDETSQRLRPLLAVTGAHRTNMHVSAQVMVCSGFLLTATCTGSHITLQKHPWHSRPQRLHGMTTNYILEGLLRALPIVVGERGQVDDLLRTADLFFLQLVMDRASVNYCAAAWLSEHLTAQYGDRALVYAEVCGMHGCSLVKQRCRTSRELATALHSFTRWLRVARNFDELSKAIHGQVSERLQVRVGLRPSRAHGDSMKVAEVLYGELYSGFLSQAGPAGHRSEKSRLCRDLEALCACVDMSAAGDAIVFYNSVTADSDEHLLDGRPIGSELFETKDMCIEHVALAILRPLMGSAWVTCTESRWTNVTATVKRFLLGMLPAGILVHALADVQVRLNVADTMEAQLLALIKRDSKDFASKSKVRLLRFARAFSQPSAKCHLALMLVVGKPIELLQACLLGKDKTRMLLGELLHPFTSPIVACQRDLYSLAENFSGKGNSSWVLLEVLGICMDDESVRMDSRRHVLQTSAGLAQVFEVRLSGWPHKLAWLTFSDCHEPTKRDLVNEFFQHPAQCLDTMSSTLRRRFPEPSRFLLCVPLVMQVFANSEHSIDFSERAHSQLRRDVHSEGSATNFVDAADRLLIRQFVNDHIEKGGSDPAAVALPTIAMEGCAPGGRAGIGSNPFQQFRSIRLRTKKRLIAPHRSLTSEELVELESTIKDEWQREVSDPKRLAVWTALHEARRRAPPPLALCDADGQRQSRGSKVIVPESAAPASIHIVGLWGEETDASHIVPPQVVVQYHKRHPQVKRATVAARSEQLVVKDGVPDRKADTQASSRGIHGCCATIKNICLRHGIAHDRKMAIEALQYRVQYWCGRLPKDGRDGAKELLLFRSSGGGVAELAILALLVLAFDSPKSQIWALCGLDKDFGAGEKAFSPPACPFMAYIMADVPRLCRRGSLGGDMRAFAFATTLELLSFMVERSPSWAMERCDYSLPLRGSLLLMEVTATSVIPGPPAKSCRRRADVSLPPEFDLGDPWSHGHAQVASSTAASGSTFPIDDEVCDSDDSFAEEAGGLAEPPQEFLDELLEEAIAEAAALPSMFAESNIEDVAGAADAGELELVEAEAVEDALEAEGALEGEDLIAEAMRLADVSSAMGYITTTIPPWCDMQPCGRLTFWPAHEPPERQSMAIRCYQHPRCSLSRRRGRFSVQEVLRWLFDSQPARPGASNQERQAARDAHMARGAILLPRASAGA